MFTDKEQHQIVRYAQALVDMLDQMYPARCIRRDESVDDHLRYAGKRELIEQLKTIGGAP